MSDSALEPPYVLPVSPCPIAADTKCVEYLYSALKHFLIAIRVWLYRWSMNQQLLPPSRHFPTAVEINGGSQVTGHVWRAHTHVIYNDTYMHILYIYYYMHVYEYKYDNACYEYL